MRGPKKFGLLTLFGSLLATETEPPKNDLFGDASHCRFDSAIPVLCLLRYHITHATRLLSMSGAAAEPAGAEDGWEPCWFFS